jgi:hypothetical protein
MLIEALILIAGAYAGRHVNISVSPEAQVVAKKLIDIGIAQLPKVATTGKPVLEAEELEVIAEMAERVTTAKEADRARAIKPSEIMARKKVAAE